MDFAGLFAINVSPLELIVRGTLTYWFLLRARDSSVSEN